MDDIKAEFSELALTDRPAAEALSEPFFQTEKYTVQTASDQLDLNPAATGVAYLAGETDDVSYAFAVAPGLARPYTCINEFITGYERTVGTYHGHNRLQWKKMPESAAIGDVYHREKAIAKTRADGLRTVAGFAILVSDDGSRLDSGFFVSSKAAVEIPLEGREYALHHMRRPETGQFQFMEEIVGEATGEEKVSIDGIVQNGSSNQRFGMYVGALLMPEISYARKLLSEDDRVSYLLSLSRKERRKLITRERKGR